MQTETWGRPNNAVTNEKKRKGVEVLDGELDGCREENQKTALHARQPLPQSNMLYPVYAFTIVKSLSPTNRRPNIIHFQYTTKVTTEIRRQNT